jgi:phage-related protein
VPATEVVFYCGADETCPVLEWFASLPEKAQDKCRVKIERLRECGHELRRPEADYLRDDIYELRATHSGIHYRILYFFHGRVAAVLAHGVIKERAVPAKDINKAIERKKRFTRNPQRHTLKGE